MKRTIAILTAVIFLFGCNTNESAEAAQDEYSCRMVDSYNYNEPVAYSDAIDDSYYSDALFAGDSRMRALSLYGDLPNAEVDYVTSLNLMKIDVSAADERDDGKTLVDLLNETDRGHIYLLFGINEIRNKNFDYFIEKYQEIVTIILTKNPETDIYIILAWHPRKISGLTDEQLNIQLQDLNSRLSTLAADNHVYYLVPDYALTDENGIIKDDYVADGLHLGPAGTRAFEDFIATHVVREEQYVKKVCE